ncbi:hypothetical protein AA0113_g800 [Alternaria arborescens]|uniref:ATPase AAA-type core domain-containing protein n=1 Tax=Alternaria arborescens TaxID=156630 RepID=A0A4V1X8C3_9PLEO|nr:hypothetical protein AA0111_g11706 [Alternaria arborescens]RYO15403.1 hypothetical protein AA0111_g11706 [Alternaria arborescens]RYO72988.1 hypothetical protein AA0113_g800 [Alternaria arborescens]
MTYVVPASKNDDPMAELIINDDYKKLLLAAAGQPLRGTIVEPWVTVWNADFVGGKDRGRVVLLYGAPGTGKTFTAECISSKTNGLLLSITTAELGTEEVQIQKRTAYYLDLASMSSAIVLSDEAEVYL